MSNYLRSARSASDRPPQECDDLVDVLRKEEGVATVSRAVHDIELDVEAGLLVRALQFERLVDWHLRVLVAMDQEERGIVLVDVPDWTGQFGKFLRALR